MTDFNRRELLAGLAMSLPGAAALTAGLAGCGKATPDGHAGRRLAVTISKETTYVTEPLRPDGYPDYVAALNERCSRGVTPENNAAVLFWKAVGPSEIEPERRAAYFKMLGVAPPPEKGNYFRSSSDHAAIQAKKDRGADAAAENDRVRLLDDEFGKAMQRPWAREEFPVWAEWLDVNQRPLAVLMEASKRPRRYYPWFRNKKDNAIEFTMGIVGCRDIARAFALRAMLRIHDGKTDEAWQDLLACHWLARLVGQGPTLVESLVAITVEGIAHAREPVLIEHGDLSAAQLAAMRREMASLPPVCNLAETLDFGERLFFLGNIVEAASQSPAEGRNFLKKNDKFGLHDIRVTPILDAMGDVEIDWDAVLRISNAGIDKMVVAFREPIPTNRRKVLADVDGEMKQWKQAATDVKSLKGLAPVDLRREGSERLGKAITVILWQSTFACNAAVTRITMGRDLNQLAFALGEYRAEHHRYPEKLGQLMPKYLSDVPTDRFNNDADLHYAPQDDGYLLYSVGPNGRDDGGRTVDDYYAPNSGMPQDKESWDDIVVRMPGKPSE